MEGWLGGWMDRQKDSSTEKKNAKVEFELALDFLEATIP
jgi:hypothetical protein